MGGVVIVGCGLLGGYALSWLASPAVGVAFMVAFAVVGLIVTWIELS